MNLGILGEPCIDYIHKPGKETTKSLGGILYSVVSLAVLSKKDHEIYPVMYLGGNEYDDIVSFLSGFENIKTDFIVRSGSQTRIVNLYYKSLPLGEGFSDEGSGVSSYDREESSTVPAPPVEFSLIEKILPRLNAILINMVSGTDVTLETLKEIRKSFPGYIHIDLHNIVMRTEPGGTRLQQPVENWEEWCTNSDTVQMNESELFIMTGSSMNENEIAERILRTDAIHGVSHSVIGSVGAIHDAPQAVTDSVGAIHESPSQTHRLPGPKALVVTRGRSGVTLFRQVEKNVMGEKYLEIDRTEVPASEKVNFKDTTGCGDVFASAFFFKNAVSKQRDYVKALKFANRIAGLKTELTGVEELHNLSVT